MFNKLRQNVRDRILEASTIFNSDIEITDAVSDVTHELNMRTTTAYLEGTLNLELKIGRRMKIVAEKLSTEEEWSQIVEKDLLRIAQKYGVNVNPRNTK